MGRGMLSRKSCCREEPSDPYPPSTCNPFTIGGTFSEPWNNNAANWSIQNSTVTNSLEIAGGQLIGSGVGNPVTPPTITKQVSTEINIAQQVMPGRYVEVELDFRVSLENTGGRIDFGNLTVPDGWTRGLFFLNTSGDTAVQFVNDSESVVSVVLPGLVNSLRIRHTESGIGAGISRCWANGDEVASFTIAAPARCGNFIQLRHHNPPPGAGGRDYFFSSTHLDFRDGIE